MGEFSHSLAVVIGINQYGNGISLLQTAVNDAKEIARILEQEHKYDKVWLLLEQEASLQALQHLLEHVLPEHVQPDDRLLFYFAGHGIALNGDDGPEGFLIPQDAKLGDTKTYLPMPKLQTALSGLPCRHFLGILDCCFAGAFRWSSTRKLVPIEQGIVHKERYDRFIQDPAWQTITSAAYDQTALDAFDLKSERATTGKHSPFAAALIEALSGQADIYPPADATRNKPAGDGVTTATDLYIYLRDRVEPATEGFHRQTPGIWPLKKHDKGEYIFLTPGHVLNLPPAPPLDESSNPYRGLQSFEAEQSDLFFGRQALTEKLCGFVTGHSLTVVLGASGSGKSSLVKAGLIPELEQRDAKADQPQWQILTPLRPGEAPFKALGNALRQENIPGFSLPEAGSAAEMLTQYMAAWSQQSPEMKLLLAIDQFEELITLCRDEKEREQFLTGLAQAVSNHPNQLRLVLTLRSDFEPQFQDGTLKADWNAARFVVPPMTRIELREAIEEPASKRVMYFQSNDPKNPLVDQLIDEVAEMPGALPLLSFTLSELYLKYLRRQKIAKERGESIDRAITEADYKELGGVVRSLTQRADQEYEATQLEGVDEITIRNVMLRMVAVSGGELTRRRVQKSELMYPEPKHERVQKLIERFSVARLLVEGLDSENQEYVEPAHDQLVLGWGKIKNWLNERQTKVETIARWNPTQTWLTERLAKFSLAWRLEASPDARPEAEQPLKVNLLLQRELTTAANHWSRKQATDGNRQAAGFLWDDDPRLPQLEQTQGSEDNWFNQTEAQFVERSVTQRRWNIRVRWMLVGTAFALLSGIAASIWYQLQVSQMREQAARVENLLQTDPVEGLVLAIQTIGQNRSTPLVNMSILPEVQSSLLSATQTARERNRFEQPVEANRSEQAFAGYAGNVYTVAFSPDSQTIATAGDGGNVYLWDLQGNLKKTLQGNTESIFQVAFSFDGETIIGIPNEANERGAIQFWDSQGNLVEQPYLQTDLSRQYSELISAARQSIEQRQARINPDQSEDLISPDGKTIVSYTERSMSIQWQVDEMTVSQPLLSQSEPILAVALSPDGRTIVNSNFDKSVSLWDVNDGNVIEQSEGTSLGDDRDNQTQALQEFLDAEFQNMSEVDTLSRLSIRSPKGEKIFTGGASMDVGGGKTCVWTLLAGHLDENHKICQVLPPTLSTAFSPDEKTVVVGLQNGSVSLWDLQNNRISSSLKAHENGVTSVAFSPDGKSIVSGSADGTVRLSNLQGQSVGRLFKEHKAAIESVEFQPDGKAVTSVSNDGARRVWSTNWEDWLKVACNRLQYHPVLKQPSNQEAEGAKVTCEKYVWNGSGDNQLSESSAIATPSNLPPLPCNLPSPLSLRSQQPGYYKDGEYYGSIETTAPPNGQLTLLFPSGDRYDGEFANGKRNGCGTYSFANGNRYTGKFLNDTFQGQGEYSWKDGEFYRGEFSDGKCHGQGTLTLADGISKSGEWQNGDLVGGSPNDTCNQ